MVKTAEEWRDFYKKDGAIAHVHALHWLSGGCPKCGCKSWTVTKDNWAYCNKCCKGYRTAYPFTREDIETFDFSEGK